MAVWSIISSNIRKKKGSFIGVFILIFIIAATVSTIVSAYLCGNERYDIAAKESNAPDIMNYISEEDYDSSMEDKLLNENEVKSVENLKTLYYRNNLTIGNRELGNSVYLYGYEPEKFSFKLENGDRMEVPKEGKIYMPKAFMDKYDCKVGDEINFTTADKNYTFIIEDFFEDTVLGSSVIGMKRMYINPEDFNRLYEANLEDFKHLYTLNTMFKDEYVGNSKTVNKINDDTGVQKYGRISSTLSSSKEYTFLMPDIMSATLLGFCVLLLVVSIIVIAQSINSSIEMEYKTYGILKAMGFNNAQLRIIILLEYVIAAIAGMILGMAVSSFLIKPVGTLILDGTGLFWIGNIKYKECIGIFASILIFISLFIVFNTRKIAKVSPVRAIAFGSAPIYFSSRMNFSLEHLKLMPLSLKLGLKQVVTHIKQSSILIVIIAILTFFTVSMYSLGLNLSRDKIVKIFDPTENDICVFYDNDKAYEIDNIKAEIEKYSNIDKEFKISNCYKVVEGDNLQVRVTDNNENILGNPKKGRNPKYNNEVLITPIIEEEFGKTIGDMITVEDTKGNKEEYMIVGIQQSMNDMGRNITMLESGMKRLDGEYSLNIKEYKIADPEKTEEIVDNLKSIYGQNSSKLRFDNDYKEQEDNFEIADNINLVTKIIFIISVIIAFLIVILVCNKSIRKIRKDIGVLKSQGCTDNDIRCQVSMEFFILSLLGSVLGTILNVMFNDKLMSLGFKCVGITDYVTHYTPITIIVPIAAIVLFSLAASWLITSKVKRITPKNLIVE